MSGSIVWVGRKPGEADRECYEPETAEMLKAKGYVCVTYYEDAIGNRVERVTGRPKVLLHRSAHRVKPHIVPVGGGEWWYAGGNFCKFQDNLRARLWCEEMNERL